MSYTTRLTLSTSLTMRTLIFVPRDAHPVGGHAIDRCYDADAYGVGVSAYYRVNYYSFTTLFGISIVAGEMTNSNSRYRKKLVMRIFITQLFV